MGEFIQQREPLQIGKKYKINEILESDKAILRIPGKKSAWDSPAYRKSNPDGPVFCRDDHSVDHPRITEIYKDEKDQWTHNQSIYEEIDPNTKVELIGFYK